MIPQKPRRICFSKSTDEYGFLGNMVGGYPILFFTEGTAHLAYTSEAFYQALKFPNHPEIQRDILLEPNGFRSKIIAKKHASKIASGWDRVKVAAMTYAVWLKVRSNREILSRFPPGENPTLVELTSRDHFWGASIGEDDQIIGENQLGKVWMSVLRMWEKGDKFPDRLRSFLKIFGSAVYHEPYEAPQTYKEAVRWAAITYPHIVGTKEEPILFHSYEGRDIRNRLKLWSEDSPIRVEMKLHPDEISHRILCDLADMKEDLSVGRSVMIP